MEEDPSDRYNMGVKDAEEKFAKMLNDAAHVEEFSKGYRQGYRDGYLAAIEDLKARAIEIKQKMGDKVGEDVYPRPWWLPPWWG